MESQCALHIPHHQLINQRQFADQIPIKRLYPSQHLSQPVMSETQLYWHLWPHPAGQLFCSFIHRCKWRTWPPCPQPCKQSRFMNTSTFLASWYLYFEQHDMPYQTRCVNLSSSFCNWDLTWHQTKSPLTTAWQTEQRAGGALQRSHHQAPPGFESTLPHLGKVRGQGAYLVQEVYTMVELRFSLFTDGNGQRVST